MIIGAAFSGTCSLAGGILSGVFLPAKGVFSAEGTGACLVYPSEKELSCPG